MIKCKYLYNIIKNKIIKIKISKLYYYGLGLLLHDVLGAEDTRRGYGKGGDNESECEEAV